ncbi:MAG: TIGR02266 family protein [Proteobacteria bacterium]|nr:TIGR02266 family protein [Pseudomonadota bacterium]
MPPKSKTVKKTSSAAPASPKQGAEPSRDDRIHHRVPVQLLVDYRANGHYLFDFCRDLGAGGVFIETKSPLSHGSAVELTFTLPDSKETLEARGRVIWVQTEVPDKEMTPGMGVQFEDFTPDQRRLLQKFVDRYSSQNRGSGSSGKTA